MERVKSHGLMELSTTETILMGRNMGKVLSSGLIMLLIKETLMTTIFTGLELISGLMDENTLGIGRIIKCMDEEYSNGQMAEDMKETM